MLNTTSQLFCSMSSVWVCLMFPHVSFRLYIFGRNSTQARLVSYFILSGDAWFSLIPLLMMFNLITWLRCCLSARLLYYKAFLFFLMFLSAGRFPLCAGKYGYWLLAPDSYSPADKGLPLSPAHPLQPQFHISFPGRASEWFWLVMCHEGVGCKGLGSGTNNPTRTINRQKSGSWKDARMIKTVYKHWRIKTKKFFSCIITQGRNLFLYSYPYS